MHILIHRAAPNFRLTQKFGPTPVLNPRQKFINSHQNFVNQRDPLDPHNFSTRLTHAPIQPRDLRIYKTHAI